MPARFQAPHPPTPRPETADVVSASSSSPSSTLIHVDYVDVPIGRGKHLRMCGHIGVVEFTTTIDTGHHDHPRAHGVEVPNRRDTLLQFPNT